MAKNTKEKIIDAAINLFSEYGYTGASMSDIAEAVGISKPALYKHFSGKEEILSIILAIGERYYDMGMGSKENMPETPKSIEELKAFTMRQIDFTVQDQMIIKIRKILAIEQFISPRVADIATKHLLTGLQDMYEVLFEGMMRDGILKKNDAKLAAFEYVAPITTLIQFIDREPEKKNEALEMLERHIDYFLGIHKD